MLNIKQISTWPIEDLVEWVSQPENQLEMYEIMFGTNYTLEDREFGVFHRLNSPILYKQVVASRAAELEAFLFVQEHGLVRLQEILANILHNGEPGHDPGHRGRDGWRMAFMLSDKNVQRMRPIEKIAGVINALDHDLSTALTPRYIDNKIVGHAEVSGAFLKAILTEMGYPILGELCAYGAGAHTHIMMDTHYTAAELPETLELRRYFYNFELWAEGDTVYGGAIALPRLADRSSMGINMFLRDLMASILATLVPGAQDRAGGDAQAVDLNEDNAIARLTPSLTPPIEKTKTSLGHITGFLGSRHPAIGGGKINTWNHNDVYFETFQALLVHNNEIWEELLAELKGYKAHKRKVDRDAVWQTFADLLIRVNVGPHAAHATDVIKTFWDKIPEGDVRVWEALLPKIEELYDRSLAFVRAEGRKAAENDDLIGPDLLTVLKDIDSQLL